LPLTACAEITFPFSSSITWTVTGPDARIALAAGGYAGVARLSARPFSAPAFTGARLDGAPGGVGETNGVGLGVNEGAELVFAEFPFIGVSTGVGVTEGVGLGVGVGVFRFALALTLALLMPPLTLKLKLLSIMVLTFVF
jgi:hypothetical protein